MKSLVSIILVFAAFLPAYGQVHTMVNPLEEMAKQLLDGGPPNENMQLFNQFVMALARQSESEIDAEALAKNMDSGVYVVSDEGVARFLSDLKQQTSDLQNMSRPKAFVLMNKTSHRLRIQQLLGKPQDHLAEVKEIQSIIDSLNKKLKIFSTQQEVDLDAVIETLKKDPALKQSMVAAAKDPNCTKGTTVNPYVIAVIETLRNGTTVTINSKVRTIIGDKRWTALTKDTADGGEKKVAGSLGYTDTKGHLAVFDVVADACGAASVPPDNFTKILDSESLKHFHYNIEGLSGVKAVGAIGKQAGR